jgi:cytochrome c-type biogenesis protein
VGGALIVLFGLHTAGVVRIPYLYYDTRRQYRPRAELGYLSSALMGFFFGAGWSPCVGATLGSILTLALDQATVGRGAVLLLAFSLGLGIPFLVLGLVVGPGVDRIRTNPRTMRTVAVVSGALMVVLGILVFTDSLAWFGSWSPLM